MPPPLPLFISGTSVTQMLQILADNQLLEKPDLCPDLIYELMLQCWRPDPPERPAFSRIKADLKRLLMLESALRFEVARNQSRLEHERIRDSRNSFYIPMNRNS